MNSKSLKYTIPVSLLCSVFTLVIFIVFFSEKLLQEWFSLLLIFIITNVFFAITIHLSFQKIILFFLSKVKNQFPEKDILESQNIQKITQELSQLTQVQQEQLTELEDREQYRRDFLGNVSHELKTPLFTIQSYALTLSEGAMKDKKVRRKYLNRINKNAERLISIVNDLDLMSELERGVLKLHYTEFNLMALAEEIIEILEIKAEKAHVELFLNKENKKSIRVIGDIKKIEQVFINLLANAIKHSNKENTKVAIHFEEVETQVKVSISDNGIGIKPENLTRIFERFYRVDSARSRKNGGSGLGLSIVKHILEAHGQTIRVDSQYQKGTTFTFTLAKNIVG